LLGISSVFDRVLLLLLWVVWGIVKAEINPIGLFGCWLAVK